MKALAVLLFFISTFAGARTIEFNPERTIEFRGPIGGSVIKAAARIETLSAASSDPIYFLINSPGGAVLPGIQVISAMNIAKARGVRFICAAPVMAASMGFQFLVNCDERYVFKYSLLLWHPMKQFIMGGMDKEDLLYASKKIRSLEKPLLAELFEALRISRKEFLYHYRHETMWTAVELKELCPHFIEIVDDIKGVKNLFGLR